MAVAFTTEGSLGFITLDKPPANSYDKAFMTEYSDAVDAAIASNARVVIVQSSNPKFFSAGADIKVFTEGNVEANMEMIRISQDAFRRMASAQQLFIAYIAGHALGGGLEIALACDIRVAKKDKYLLGLPEVKLGLLPGNGGTQRLTRLIWWRSCSTETTPRLRLGRMPRSWPRARSSRSPRSSVACTRAVSWRSTRG
jgi:enoyl-CoA hydratase/carnithine racemase